MQTITFNALTRRLDIIRQNQSAIEWIEGYKESQAKDKTAQADYGLKISANTRGSGLTGFQPAAELLNQILGDKTPDMLNEALKYARARIAAAEAEIKQLSADL